MEYKEKTTNCSGCTFDSPLEHKLFHESGLSQGVIRELNLSSLSEIHEAFKNASYLSACHINLNGRRTKVRVENKYILPKALIDMIGTATRN